MIYHETEHENGSVRLTLNMRKKWRSHETDRGHKGKKINAKIRNHESGYKNNSIKADPESDQWRWQHKNNFED